MVGQSHDFPLADFLHFLFVYNSSCICTVGCVFELFLNLTNVIRFELSKHAVEF